MHDLMHWDDDEPELPRGTPAPAPQLAGAAQPPPQPALTARPDARILFRDVLAGDVRQGTLLRVIQSREHENAHLGHLPAVSLYLVEYESATRPRDYAVVYDALIVQPKKPRS